MAAIIAINARQHGAFAAALTTLTSSDTITRDTRFKQFLVLRNAGGAPLTLTIDGDGGGNINAPGLGVVNTGPGLQIAVPAGEVRAVDLDSIDAYTKGIVTLSGASGLIVQLFNL
jgi:hypothetical protein